MVRFNAMWILGGTEGGRINLSFLISWKHVFLSQVLFPSRWLTLSKSLKSKQLPKRNIAFKTIDIFKHSMRFYSQTLIPYGQKKKCHISIPQAFLKDYLRANVSVLLACHVIATCDFNWGHSFSQPKKSIGCQTYHLKWKT